MKKIALSLAVSSLLASSAHATLINKENPTGLKVGVSVDLLGSFGEAAPVTDKGRFFLREAEISFLAPIDQTFEGVLSLAAHREGEIDSTTGIETSEMHIGIHEAYISTSKLIPRSRIRLGQFFLGIGRLNQFHRHDWPFVSAPRIHEELFGDEGILDQGLEYSFLAPTDFYLDFTLGITNGWGFGKGEGLEYRPKMNTHYARVATYLDAGEGSGALIGLNYLSNTGLNLVDEAGPTYASRKNTHFGLDATYKVKEGKSTKFLFQSEFWQRKITQTDFEEGKVTKGFYLYPEMGLGETMAFGVRFDFTKNHNYQDMATGEDVNENIIAYVPTLTYKPSEFSSFRVAYTKETNTRTKEEDLWKAEIQSVFILGTHPAHDF